MKKILAFQTLRLHSKDVARSRNWYKNLFDATPIEDQETFVSFQIANVCLDIVLADEKSPTSTGGSVGYWLVEDLEYFIEKAEKSGGKIHRGPLIVKETQRRIVQIIDPEGNVIGFEETI